MKVKYKIKDRVQLVVPPYKVYKIEGIDAIKSQYILYDELEKTQIEIGFNIVEEGCSLVEDKQVSIDDLTKLKPKYYNYRPLSCTEVQLGFANENEYIGFCELNILKYLYRYKQKNGKEDLLKLKQYVDFIIEALYDKSKSR